MDVGFVSFCTGANSTIIAMSKEPNKFRNVWHSMRTHLPPKELYYLEGLSHRVQGY